MISFRSLRSIDIFILPSRNICQHTRYFNGVLKIQYASQTRNVDNILLNTTIIQSPFKYLFERQNVKWHETWIREKKGSNNYITLHTITWNNKTDMIIHTSCIPFCHEAPSLRLKLIWNWRTVSIFVMKYQEIK